MRKLIHLFCFISILSFSQKKENYYFDYVSKISIKNNSTGINEVKYVFSNSNDSTYSLELKYFNENKIAQLINTHEKKTVEFKLEFDYKSIKDLEKLVNPYTVENEKYFTKNKKINYFEDIEYEKDSINNQIIVHITQFKNIKKKNILNEHYYFFSQSKELNDFKQSRLLNYLIFKKNLVLLKGYHFQKSLCLIDGKINSEFQIHFFEKIDYTLNIKK